ncbi:hypothetical protein [Microbacterium sulfonylureivorans]|uniref:hypothetical protein n=1 Tax=Microbacterium sulfonylureivorans TaxID=2486854 RepID=UPI000FD8508A|nr:hypothetical protein [Microbacterium sulfonylureivorans]
MTVDDQIRDVLITRDIDGFVAGDFELVRSDFDESQFTAYSGADGSMRLTYPDLEGYRADWLAQAETFRDVDPAVLTAQLHAVQRIARLEVSGTQALATKIFDGEVDTPVGPTILAWTTYYFLRAHESEHRWLITGFVGYLPSTWSTS